MQNKIIYTINFNIVPQNKDLSNDFYQSNVLLIISSLCCLNIVFVFNVAINIMITDVMSEKSNSNPTIISSYEEKNLVLGDEVYMNILVVFVLHVG